MPEPEPKIEEVEQVEMTLQPEPEPITEEVSVEQTVSVEEGAKAFDTNSQLMKHAIPQLIQELNKKPLVLLSVCFSR